MALVRDADGHTFIEHANGQRTHYISDDFTDPWQPRETVLIQHGFCRTAAHWYHWVPALSRAYRVIRRDLRGHGLSSYPSSIRGARGEYDYSLDCLLEEILDLLNCLGIDKVHFLGESTSGMLAEALAAKHPERLHSITVCSSPTHLPPSALNLFSFGHDDWPTACRTLGSRGWAEALSRLPGTVASEDEDYVSWWTEQVSVSDGEGLAGYASFLSTMDARPFLSQIKIPMLILAPKHSAVMTKAQMEDVASQVPGAHLELIDAPGHEIFVSGASQCQAAVLKFWTRVGSEASI
ncbi:alpha/beta-hydrolase [Sphaerulina musiva SO2202]|uniref:Alpha/beta-hydrolase n=1 Tax=Sphaerulina musiva (strain SO2202) TaxID=692275 RepID=N1QII0_SPHMS|nr:alpha/beta-hydrolase [Sphaerulina musiva SO2202]EMF10379.1 alpha/beta-hydrolase [Sphaerulina musiva SO2202]